MNSVRWISISFLFWQIFQMSTLGSVPWPPDVGVSPQNPMTGESVTITFSDTWPDNCVPRPSTITYHYNIESEDHAIYVTISTPSYFACIEGATAWEQQISLQLSISQCYDVYVELEDGNHGNQPFTKVATFCVQESSEEPEVPWPPTVSVNPTNPTTDQSVTLSFSDIWPDNCVPVPSTISYSYNYEQDKDAIYVTISTPLYVTCTSQSTAWQQQISTGPFPIGCYDVYVALEDNYHADQPFTKVTSFCVHEGSGQPNVPWPPDISITPTNPTTNHTITISLSDIWPDNCVPVASTIDYSYNIEQDKDAIYITVSTPAYFTCLNQPTLWQQQIKLLPFPMGCYDLYVGLVDINHADQPMTKVGSFCVSPDTFGTYPISLMPNSSFEDHSNGSDDPDGWSLWGSDWQQGDSTQSWWQDCNLARTGCWAARLRAGSNDFALAASPLIETVPQKTYYVGVWIKDLKPAHLRSATPARFQFQYLDSETQGNLDESKIYAADLPIPLDNQWHWADVNMNPSTTHPWVRVLLLVENSANDGSESDYLFDDFWFGEDLPYHGDRYVAVAAGSYHNLALKYDGSIVGWGNNDFGQADPPPGNDYIAIAGGQYYSLALRADGTLIAWGDNSDGQTDVPDGNDFVAIASGLRHGLALTVDGRILQWGDEQRSQGTPPGGNDYVGIASGAFQSLALKSDGSLVGWGNDSFGQASPPDGNDFADMVGGRRYSVGLKSDGSMVGWGTNPDLETGMPAGTDFVAVDIGAAHGIALKKDGSLVAWGNNDLGQTETPGGNDFTAISAGRDHCLALKADGTIVGWGNNEYGQASPPDGNDL